MNKIKKLGLVGTLLAGAAVFLSGCSSSPKFPPISNEYGLNLAKTNIQYEKGIDKANKKFIQDASNALNEARDLLFDQADKEGLNRLKQAYESEKKAIEQRNKITGKSQPANSNNQEEYTIDADLYAFQRNQIKGEDHPKNVNGLGLKFRFPIAGRLGAYAKGEFDQKYREVNVPGTGSLDLTSTGTTFGAGLDYKLINSDAFKLSLYSGLFNRTESNRINGVVGISPIRDKDTTSQVGAEAGIGAGLYLGKNVRLIGGADYEDYNLSSGNNDNAKSGIKYSLGVGFGF